MILPNIILFLISFIFMLTKYFLVISYGYKGKLYLEKGGTMNKKVLILAIGLLVLTCGCVEKISDERTGMKIRSNIPAENVTSMNLHFKIIPRTEIETMILPNGIKIEGKQLSDGKTKKFDSMSVYTDKKDDIRNIIIEWNQPVRGKEILANITVRGSKNFSTYILAEGINEKGEKIEMNAEGVRYER